MAACSMSLEMRLKLPAYLNIYKRGYVQVIWGCVSLCLNPFSVPPTEMERVLACSGVICLFCLVVFSMEMICGFK